MVTNTHIVADAIGLAAGGTGGGPEAPLDGALISVTLQDGRCLLAQLVNYDWCGATWSPRFRLSNI